jgi:hypothetical protein
VFPIIKSRADESGENKLFSLYHAAKCFKRIPASKPSFKLTTSYVEKISTVENIEYGKELEKDLIIDRIKGFAYCYLIGANSSVTNELAEIRVLTKNIKNTLAAIINSPTHKPTTIQDEKLLNDIQRFNSIFQSIDKTCIQNRKRLDYEIAKVDPSRDGLTTEAFLKLLERAGLKETFEARCGLRTTYDAFDLYSCITCSDSAIPSEYRRVISELSSAVEHIETEQEQIEVKPELMFNLADEGKVDILDKTFHLDRYNDFINALIRGDHKKGDLPKSLAIAVMCGNILKKCSADQWEGSSAQKYLNELLGSLQESTRTFDMNSIDSSELKALAAFAQKGSDIDKLSNYLLNCGVSDYRLAYGLYGATEGFATLPKTFTSDLLDKADNYTWAAYKFIFQSCFKVSLDAYQLSEKCCGAPNVKMQERSEQKSLVESDAVSRLLHDLEQNVPKFRDLKKEESKSWIIEKITECYEGRVDSIYLEKMNTNMKAPHGAGDAFKACKTYMQKISKQNKKMRSSQLPLTGISSQRFFEDVNARSFIDTLLLERSVNQEVSKRIISNLVYIQQDYKPGRKSYQDEKRNPRDNSSVIRHFTNVCFSQNNRDRIDRTQENIEILDSIANELRKKYL